MNSVQAKWRSRNMLVLILILQFAASAFAFFDIPVARQVIGFIYFTFVPGFVFIKLLKLIELDGLETVLFSVGLSVAFLMLAGFLINEFCSLFGVSNPLSPILLMIILNSFALAGTILIYLRSETMELCEVKTFAIPSRALLLAVLPILSIVGVLWVNAFENNVILLFLLLVISLLFVIVTISKRLSPPMLYPFAVLMIAISLLFHFSLISNYIVPCGDSAIEHMLFETTKNSAHWSSSNPYFGSIEYGRLNSMLSVTVLPTIYSNLLNMDSTWVFKMLFPLIFAFVPLGLYKVFEKYWGKKHAFISVFLFMAEATFHTEMLGQNRQIIAELFFVLLLLLILNKKMTYSKKMLCIMIFSFALITSHYALAEIFSFFVSFTLISLVVFKRPSRNITVSMVVLFLVAMFTWYIYTSNSSAFNSFLMFGDYIYSQLGEFFSLASRGQTVLRGLGLESATSIWSMISRVFAYLTEALILVGFVGLVTKRTKIHLEKEYFALTLLAVTFLAAIVLVPGLADTLNMTRFYHILLFFLAPLCVLGVQILVNLVGKRRREVEASILLLVVLVPYFLFQTGFVYEVTKVQSWSIPLSLNRMGLRAYTHGTSHELDVVSAEWLSRNVDRRTIYVYADSVSLLVTLTMYSMIYREKMEFLSNVTQIAAGRIVYLSHVNIDDNLIVSQKNMWNTTSVLDLNSMNIVYTNGASEIAQAPPK